MDKNNPLLSIAAWSARLMPTSAKRALYRIEPLARLIRRGLNQAAPQGLTAVEVAAGELAGLQLYLDLQSEKDYWLGTYEPELQAAIRDFVEPGMVAYDVGANIGYISLLLARSVGETGRVFSFEALPANLKRLRSNLALNDFDERVQVIDGAVINCSQPVRFLVGPSGGMGKADGSTGRQEFTYQETLTVEGIALNDFVYDSGNPPPEVVKMDIEGGEVLALPGMQRVLEQARPLVFLELHGPEAAETAWNTLTTCGYQISRMRSGYPAVSSTDTLDWKSYLVGIPLA